MIRPWRGLLLVASARRRGAAAAVIVREHVTLCMWQDGQQAIVGAAWEPEGATPGATRPFALPLALLAGVDSSHARIVGQPFFRHCAARFTRARAVVPRPKELSMSTVLPLATLLAALVSASCAAAAEPGSDLFEKGCRLYEGTGGKVDWVEAARLLTQAAEKNHPKAQVLLAFMLANGFGLEKDEEAAQGWAARGLAGTKAMAARGDAAAQWLLGAMFCKGWAGPGNQDEAIDWFRKAAQQNLALAQHELGSVYLERSRGKKETWNLGFARVFYFRALPEGQGVVKDEQEALMWFRKAADQHLAMAEQNLGSLYSNGQGVPKDHAEAARWYRKAAEQNLPSGQFALAAMYLKGLGVKKEANEAFRWLRRAAEQNFAPAQAGLGEMYVNGWGVKKDDNEAVKWLRRAAVQDVAMAQHNLGVMYAAGRGVKKDDNEAYRWFRKAAEQDLPLAQTALGSIYLIGQGVTKDGQQALKWFRRAADQDWAPAQYDLGLMYVKGEGVSKDDREAAKWFLKAAKQGIAEAQYDLGVLYANGSGVEKDEKEAAKWFRLAADQQYALAEYNLGVACERGLGLQKDVKEALIWFRKAADQNFAPAQCALGNMYLNGKGAEKNDSEALKWYTKAAKQGQAQAQNQLGFMYSSGVGVQIDEEQATVWFRLAAEQGYAVAQLNLGKRYVTGQGVSKNLQEGLKWVRRAADQNLPEAIFGMGFFYENGENVQKDEREALKWYRKGAALGDEQARKALELLTLKMSSTHQGKEWSYVSPPAMPATKKSDSDVLMSDGQATELNLAEAQDHHARHFWCSGVAENNDAAATTCGREQAAEAMDNADQYLSLADRIGVAKDEKGARSWPRNAPQQGLASALFSTGGMDDGGPGVGQDVAPGDETTRKAVDGQAVTKPSTHQATDWSYTAPPTPAAGSPGR
jgi:TPR repeat protein